MPDIWMTVNNKERFPLKPIKLKKNDCSQKLYDHFIDGCLLMLHTLNSFQNIQL